MMATLHIPDHLIDEFGDCIEVWRPILKYHSEERKELYEILEKFIAVNTGTKLPCPYCKSKNLSVEPLPLIDYKAVICCNCGCNGSSVHIEDDDQIEKWNSRVGEPGTCLWCGYAGTPEDYDYEYDGENRYVKWCPDCGAAGPVADTREEARRLWENRPR